jgi:integrase
VEAVFIMLLDDRFKEFLETARGQSACNRRNYEQRLRTFLALYGRKPAATVTAAEVNIWHRELEKRRLAPATLAGYRQAIKALFNYCIEVGDIIRSPAAHLAIGSFASSRADKLPAEEAVRRVTELAWRWSSASSLCDGRHAQQVRDALIWLLSLTSGPRLGEIRNLLTADAADALRLGPDEHGVYRVPSTGKTGRVQIRFPGDVARVMETWLRLRPASATPECFITTRPDATGAFRALTRSAASHIYERICAAAGVEPTIFSHALRHRLGDLIARRHGPKVAAILLNHRDWQTAATAIAFYHHPDESDASLAILSGGGYGAPQERDELHRLFGIRDL